MSYVDKMREIEGIIINVQMIHCTRSQTIYTTPALNNNCLASHNRDSWFADFAFILFYENKIVFLSIPLSF